MGMEIATTSSQEPKPIDESDVGDLRVLTTRPSILLVGPPAVGKRSLLNRLISKETSASATSESGPSCHGWTIDTKYYTADVCIWMARLESSSEDSDFIQVQYGRSEALVMVFDLSNDASFKELQEWATKVALENFEILLCVGNKADHVPEHFAHAEYRRKLQKGGESSSDPHPEFWDFGIDRSEGSSLLGEESSSSAEDARRSRIEWCSERGIEYIEACAINEVFDKCMSVDGDLQGVARIHGALSAHMWPGLVMKESNQREKSTTLQPEQEGSTSDDDSDYYIEYELLSNGSAEPWDGSGWEDQWTQAPSAQDMPVLETSEETVVSKDDADAHPRDSVPTVSVTNDGQNEPQPVEVAQPEAEPQLNGAVVVNTEDENGVKREDADINPGINAHVDNDFDEIDQLMHEMASMRENMRTVSDHHRREMAAQLAMRMAAMFKDDDEEADSE
ncbi:alpha- and gamma-adaptin-binding protein p34 [Marchantia polymorpha subsp. ruderalis]|uniref:Uncharacterized protein n=2 Tax=Marchantia polymorpha TaxID=3197 RepID=A0A176VX21_MARPO|nr:hypothetical protein AXG93_4620s1210 [Marchantia polymorpha subsp. ruderalis]PTQ43629.1 hypothetical protein MARPO_0024s0125 [Marchantia polymorpha]PTQ43630.1 hypothetical protein MARPO_0024s0125 [Marchantia polymorpha]PTQ43631.1 hypothetical protein MARPO_0024s0125 [Marchantia polymorpha]PTQ43632.1 hypothetical protein MARPO_0024s0125 [Marchantia polymorpha]|eukprot:PTQ43629.1 hypothetical protein MARPO_0024s0125 [Marchantia polymorpha]